MPSGTSFPANVDTTDNYGQWADLAQTTLNGAITAGATSIVVTDATGFPLTGGFFVSIEAEIIFCIGRTGNTLNVDQRGAGGTTAATHADTTPVNMFLVADQINDLINTLIAIETELGSNTPAVGTVKERLASAESSVTTNQTNISTNTGNIATNTGNIATNTSDIGTNQTNINQNAVDIATNVADIAATVADVADLRTLTETSDGDTDFGTFPGSILSNAARLKTLLTELEAVAEANQTNIASNTSSIGTNAGNIASNTSDIADNTSDIADVRSTTGTSDGDTNMGAYTGASGVVTDNQDTKQNIQDLIDYVTHPNRREWVVNGGWSNLPANGTEQMSWGHDAGNDGWVADIDMELIGMSIHVNPTTGTGSAELRLEIDGVQQTGLGNVITLDGNVGVGGETMSREDGFLVLGTPIQITAGEVVHSVIVTSSWGNTGSDGSITLRFRAR